jgi:hypothetical protein
MEKKKKKTWRIERVVGGFLEERERELRRGRVWRVEVTRGG